MKTRYLLDTSALLAHLLQENGADIVERCLGVAHGNSAVCIVTWVEFEIFLKRSSFPEKERMQILSIYRTTLGGPLPVDDKVGDAAVSIRETIGKRIHLTDLLIAACAKAHGMHLVYRDKHLEGIPDEIITQIRLPAK